MNCFKHRHDDLLNMPCAHIQITLTSTPSTTYKSTTRKLYTDQTKPISTYARHGSASCPQTTNQKHALALVRILPRNKLPKKIFPCRLGAWPNRRPKCCVRTYAHIVIARVHPPFFKFSFPGMNMDELKANKQLTQVVVHDLNKEPKLDFPTNSFDAVRALTCLAYWSLC